VWLLLPAGTALVYFALTRQFGPALALLIATAAVCGRERARVLVGAVSVAGFLLGAWLITVAGTAFGYREFTLAEILHADGPTPPTLLLGHNLVIGPGYVWQDFGLKHSGIGYGPDVLIVLGRETGGAGVAAIWLIFALLLYALFRLVPPRGGAPVASAFSFGVACLLTGQITLAVLITLRVMYPIGVAPPLLAGGAPDFTAVLTAIGMLIGLSWRSSPVQARGGTAATPIEQIGELKSEATTT
jgi:hypothetical protein